MDLVFMVLGGLQGSGLRRVFRVSGWSGLGRALGC